MRIFINTPPLPIPIPLLLLLFMMCVVSLDAYTPQNAPLSRRKDQNNNNNDWMEAEMTARQFPQSPSTDLTAEQVALGCLRSMQILPNEEGFHRIHPFLTAHCRAILTNGRRNLNHAQDENDDDDDEATDTSGASFFVEEHPVLSLFASASKIQIREADATISPATKVRGDIVSMPVEVHHGMESAFVHAPSGRFVRPAIASHPKISNVVIRLEQCRGGCPPHPDCWLVREIVNVDYAKGGQGWSRDEGV